MVIYVTFGSGHRHEVDGKFIDGNCVVKMQGNREDVFAMFGPKFCFEYTEEEFEEKCKKDNFLIWFPRGVIEI